MVEDFSKILKKTILDLAQLKDFLVYYDIDYNADTFDEFVEYLEKLKGTTEGLAFKNLTDEEIDSGK